MGALRDIKRDMALRRNSLQKQLVAEIEARVFLSVSAPAAAQDDDDDDDADEAGSSGSLSPSERPPSQSQECSYAGQTPRAFIVADAEPVSCAHMPVGEKLPFDGLVGVAAWPHPWHTSIWS